MSSASDAISPAAAEADAEQARAGLVSTLNQLRENLKPANVVNEVVSNARVGASAITDQVWETARQNPLPALMIGAGLAMIFGVGARAATARPGVVSSGTPAVDRSGGPETHAHITGPIARPEPSTATSTARGKRTSQAIDGAGRKAGDMLDSANERLGRAAAQGAEAISRTFTSSKETDPMSTLSNSRGQLGNSISRLLDEQPLILAAIGVAVGAALGAALPLTERENSLMGETSHSVRDAATSMAQEQVSQLKAAATHAVDDIKQSAAEHGVNTDNLSGLVRDVGEKTKSAAYEAGRGVNPET